MSGVIAGTFASASTLAQNDVVVALVMIASILLLSSLFIALVTVLTYTAAYAWANYERKLTKQSEAAFAFDLNRLLGVGVTWATTMWFALSAAVSGFLNLAQSTGRALFNNPRRILLGVLALTLAILWAVYLPELQRFYAEFHSCFLRPIRDTLILPFTNLYQLSIGQAAPLLNAVRQVYTGITTQSILEALRCSAAQSIELLRGISLFIASVSVTFSLWLQSGTQIFSIGPDFAPAGLVLSETINNATGFTNCLCDPLSDIAVEPLLTPFESDKFVAGVNNTLALPFVALTQGLLRPIVLSSINSQEMPNAPLDQIVVRPSFNSTFDTARAALYGIAGTQDLFLGGFVEVIVNTIQEVLSRCPGQPGWTTVEQCSVGAPGVCSGGTCVTQQVLPAGCCTSFLAVDGDCQAATSFPQCFLQYPFGTVFAEYEECLNVPKCELEFGCCYLGPFTDNPDDDDAQTSATCIRDSKQSDCTGRFVPGFDCDGTYQLFFERNLQCETVVPLLQPFTQPGACGSCSVENAPCECEECLCRYRRDGVLAVGACADNAEQTQGDECEVPIEFEVMFPMPGPFTAMNAILIDLPVITPFRYGFNILFNIDLVFSTEDGFEFWNLEPFEDTITIIVEGFVSIGVYAGDVFEELSDLVENLSLDDSANVPSAHARAAELTQEQRSRLDSAYHSVMQIVSNFFFQISEIFKAIADLGSGIILAPTRIFVFGANQLVGSIYTSVATAIDGTVPDPFAFAKASFGDDAPPGTLYRCSNTRGTSSDVFIEAFVNNRLATPCNDRADILRYCEIVFDRAAELAFSGAPIPLFIDELRPSHITLDAFVDENTMVQTTRGCFEFDRTCQATVELAVTEPEAVNQFREAYEEVLLISRALDRLLRGITTVSDPASPFFDPFEIVTRPFIDFAVIVTDFTIHLDRVVTTTYVACLDVNRLIGSTARIFEILPEILREVQSSLSTDCDISGDSRFLCALAQVMSGGIGVTVEVFRFVWELFRVIVELGNNGTADEILEALSLERINGALFNVFFGIWSLPTQVIPDSLMCDQVEPNCCSLFDSGPNMVTDNPDQMFCLGNTDQATCSSLNAALNGIYLGQSASFIGFFRDNTCFQEEQIQSRQCIAVTETGGPTFAPTDFGCCRRTIETISRSVNECTDNQNAFLECNTSEQTLFTDQFCSDVTSCPSQRTRDVVVNALTVVTTDGILLIPRTLLGILNVIIEVLDTGFSGEPFSQLVSAVLLPIGSIIVQIFRQIGLIFGCADASAFNLFGLIADVLEDVVEGGIAIIADLVQTAFLFLAGLIELFVLQSITLLLEAVEGILNFIVNIAFVFLGTNVTCGAQNALCWVTGAPVDLFGEENVINFAVEQCRVQSCCCQVMLDDGWVDACDDDSINNNVQTTTCVGFDDSVCPPLSVLEVRCAGLSASPLMFDDGVSVAADADDESVTLSFTEEFRAMIREVDALHSAAPASGPSDEFCGSYTATLGAEEVRRRAAQDNDTTAQQCQAVLAGETDGLRGSIHQSSLMVAIEREVRPYIYFVKNAPSALVRNWQQTSRRVRSSVLTVEQRLFLAVHQRNGENATRAEMLSILHSKPQQRERTTRLVQEASGVFMRKPQHLLSREERQKKAVAEKSVLRGAKLGSTLQRLGDDIAALIVLAHTQYTMAPTPLTALHNAIASAPEVAEPIAWHALVNDPVQRVARLIAIDYIKSRVNLIRTAFTERAARFFSSPSAEQVANVRPQSRRRADNYFRALNPGQHYAARFDGRSALAPAFFTNDTFELLDIESCADRNQTVCTGCLVIDNLFDSGEKAFNNLRRYYTNDTIGAQFYLDRFVDDFNETFVDFFGDDTYTTCPKDDKWLLTRLRDVHWFWCWDYTPLTEILEMEMTMVADSLTDGGVGVGQLARPRIAPLQTGIDMFMNDTLAELEARAAAAERRNLEIDILRAIADFIRPAIEAFESSVAAAVLSASFSTIGKLVERFLLCDYENALMCTSDLGIGLFDGFIHATLVVAIVYVGLRLFLRLPGISSVFNFTLGMGSLMFYYSLTLWFAYGASPLCTTVAIGTGIGGPLFPLPLIGIPVCFPADAHDLWVEAIPKCPPTIIATLIDPRDFEEADSTLCATCGTAPRQLDCSRAAGFVGSLDVVFYASASIFGDSVNAQIASSLSTVNPVVADVAALYTVEYIEELGQVGEDCFYLHIHEFFVGLFLIGITTLLSASVLVILVLFLAPALASWFIAFGPFMSEAVRQLDEGFVQGTRVQKLKID